MTGDRERLEQRLRDALNAQATDVTPDPQTWDRVRDRIRFRQGWRWAVVGTAGLAAIVLVAVVVPNVPALRVEFAPEPGDQPDASAAAAPTVAPVVPTEAPSSDPTAAMPSEGLDPGSIATVVPPPEPAPTSNEVEVQVFFGASEQDCAAVEPVTRTVMGPGVLRGALDELLHGPTAAEAASGASSWFSEETGGLVNEVTIDPETGVARIDFSSELLALIPGASTSCGSTALLAQLDATALQFPTVRNVRYSFDGSEEVFYYFLQQVVPPEPGA